jgi:hypothetical protein
MRRYPSLTWEYGPKTREILAARELAAANNPEEVTRMPRNTHGAGVRKRPQPQPIKTKKPSK